MTRIVDQCWRLHRKRPAWLSFSLVLLLFAAGCQTSREALTQTPEPQGAKAHVAPTEQRPLELPAGETSWPVRLVSNVAEADVTEGEEPSLPPLPGPVALTSPNDIRSTPLDGADISVLIATAAAGNRELTRLQHEAAAAWARARAADKLPDPILGANIFLSPIETAAGSQRANLSVMQMIPWLSRLDAEAAQACFEAMSAQQMYLAERLRVEGDLHAAWAKLYVLGRQIEILEANQQLLDSLGTLAAARLGQNQGTAGDVTFVAVELGRIEEQLLTTRQQIRSTVAELNRLSGRSADAPVSIPNSLPTDLPDWSYEELRQIAWTRQPAISAAQLRTHATRWGIEVAELKRRPDVSLGVSWFAIDDNRPSTSVVDVGQDAWSIGAQVSLPLWHSKYDAISDAATWKHFASHASVDDLRLRYDALIRDLWEQARAAHETSTLYRDTLIPQARQTLVTDQQALANGVVDLERVIQDVRTVLTLELGYDRALGQLATAIARIHQATGGEGLSGVE